MSQASAWQQFQDAAGKVRGSRRQDVDVLPATLSCLAAISCSRRSHRGCSGTLAMTALVM